MERQVNGDMQIALAVGKPSLDLRECFGLVDEICNTILRLNDLREQLDSLAGQFLGELEEGNTRTDRLEALLVTGLLSDHDLDQ